MVRDMILGARSSIRVMTCYLFATEMPHVRLIRDLLPSAAKRNVRVRQGLHSSTFQLNLSRF